VFIPLLLNKKTITDRIYTCLDCRKTFIFLSLWSWRA